MRSSLFRSLFVVASTLLATACIADDPITSEDGIEQVPEVAPSEGSADSGSAEEPPPPPNEKIVEHDYQVQETSYWCGPAATRVALSARIAPPSQGALASQLGTTTNGTDWIGQITQVLNNRLGAPLYVTTEMPNDPPTAAQRDKLWQDVLRTIDADHVLVANIVAPPGNQPPGYPSNQTVYHYFAVVGYNREKQQVYIADSADFSPKHYWLTFDQLATLVPPKGYAALKP